MPTTAKRQLIRWLILAGAPTVLLAGALGLQGHSMAEPGPRGVQTAAPNPDPLLILHPHLVRFAAALAGGLKIEGTLSPGLPGPNEMQVRILHSSVHGSKISLSAAMPGMVMPAVHAQLTAQGNSYRGTIVLPMFGSYRATVAVASGSALYSGIMSLPLPIPLDIAGNAASKGNGQ